MTLSAVPKTHQSWHQLPHYEPHISPCDCKHAQHMMCEKVTFSLTFRMNQQVNCQINPTTTCKVSHLYGHFQNEHHSGAPAGL